MTDSSLDDFFAKKDKKKGKNKTKFTGGVPESPGDILAKETEEPPQPESQRKEKKEKSQNSQQSTPSEGGAGAGSKPGDEEEWKDYEDEEEKDYTGLRIQNLQIGNEKEEEGTDEVGETEIDEDGEVREKKDTGHGPWNKIHGGATPAAAAPPPPEPEPQPEPKKEAEAPATTGKYIPPSVRRAMASGESNLTPKILGHGGGGRMRSKKNAPDLQNEYDFPVLGRGPVQQAPPSVWGQSSPGDTRFEKVRSGGRQEDTRGQRQQLELGNKFDALGRGDMD